MTNEDIVMAILEEDKRIGQTIEQFSNIGDEANELESAIYQLFGPRLEWLCWEILGKSAEYNEYSDWTSEIWYKEYSINGYINYIKNYKLGVQDLLEV